MAKRILIVEDEVDNLTLLVHVLKYVLNQEDLLIAADGHEAITMAIESFPDLILLDLTIPKISGWEVARSLKANSRLAKTQIIALTAHAMVGDKEDAIKAGCDDYFAKPLDIDSFIEFIAPYLEEDGPASAETLKTSDHDHSRADVRMRNPEPQPSSSTLETTADPSAEEMASGRAAPGDTENNLARIRPQDIESRKRLADIYSTSKHPADKAVSISSSSSTDSSKTIL